MNSNSFDIAHLDAEFHLKALGKRIYMPAPLGSLGWCWQQKKIVLNHFFQGSEVDGDKQSVTELENDFKDFFAVKHCIATGSGRDAIKLALLAMDLQPGDRVVLPSFCCLSVLLPVLELGLAPILADSNENMQLDPASVERVMRPGDKVLIVPHLFGGLADIDKLTEIARSNGARIIDDAAQAIGLKAASGLAGSGGDAGIFSFGLFKPLNALGGGVFVTNDDDLFERAAVQITESQTPQPSKKRLLKTLLKVGLRNWTYRLFLSHRRQQQRAEEEGAFHVGHDRSVIGIEPLSAQLALSQLSEICAKREQAKNMSAVYAAELKDVGLFSLLDGGQAGFPRLVIRLEEQRAPLYREFFSLLLSEGIEVQPTYRPLHRILKELGVEMQGEYERSEKLAERLICLPFSPGRDFSFTLQTVLKVADMPAFWAC